MDPPRLHLPDQPNPHPPGQLLPRPRLPLLRHPVPYRNRHPHRPRAAVRHALPESVHEVLSEAGRGASRVDSITKCYHRRLILTRQRQYFCHSLASLVTVPPHQRRLVGWREDRRRAGVHKAPQPFLLRVFQGGLEENRALGFRICFASRAHILDIIHNQGQLLDLGTLLKRATTHEHQVQTPLEDSLDGRFRQGLSSAFCRSSSRRSVVRLNSLSGLENVCRPPSLRSIPYPIGLIRVMPA